MAKEFRKNIKGRGASSNTTNRFLSTNFEATEEDSDNYQEDGKPLLKTEVIKDTSKTILTKNNSPDVGFTYSVNSYRGCEHGCAYCYARPTHEYLGFSAGLDFESKIHVKFEAPKLLREALVKKSWQPETIFMSGITDCYQPLERKYQLTRGCLEVLAEFKNPVGIITKNSLVTRDLDILSEMAQWSGAFVFLSITTLDVDLARSLEPRTSTPQAKLQAIEKLAMAGVKVGVNVAPLIPGLTDHELPGILKQAREAGARWAGYTPLRLPLAVRPLFEEWLTVHRHLKKEKVLSAIRDIRDGKLNSSEFGDRMRGSGARADQMSDLFHLYTRKFRLNEESMNLNHSLFKRPEALKAQMSFDLD